MTPSSIADVMPEGPQYGAGAYIKAIIASDALANRNRPDAEYQWMIDKLTRDGGSVEEAAASSFGVSGFSGNQLHFFQFLVK